MAQLVGPDSPAGGGAVSETGVLHGDVQAAEPQVSPPPVDPPLPPLRQELSLYEGPATRHGSPTWTIYDPAAYRFYRIGWLEMEIISRWGLGSVGRVLDAVQEQTPLRPTQEDMVRVLAFVTQAGLVVTRTPEGVERLAQQREAQKSGMATWLLRNYLFFRVPLIRPDALLERLLPWVNWAFGKAFLWFVLLTASVGAFLIARQWTFFRQRAADLFTPEGAFMAGLAIVAIKIVHEFGHGLAAKRHGCRVPSMGLAFMVFYPVLWTDTTESWKLKERGKRLQIVASGMVSELAIAALASVAWSVLPEGAWRTAAYVLAATAWIMSLAINCNPFMRYDGYYLLSDLLETPDLQTRSFALGKWRLREFLFGFKAHRPYTEESGRERLLIAYAYGTWIYRFFLFTGIAFAVYLIFFKALGLVLMTIELYWFLAMPVIREMKAWVAQIRGTERFRPPLRTLAILAVALFLLVAPWQRGLRAPAMFTAARQTILYSPRGARLDKALVDNGDFVEKGALLWLLSAPSLEFQTHKVRLQIEEVRYRLSLDSMFTDLMRFLRADLRELEQHEARLRGMEEERARLTVAAPYAGRVTDLPPWLRPGVWVAKDEALGILVSTEREVTAYINEEDLDRVHPGAKGLFYPRGGVWPPLRLVVRHVAPAAETRLKYPQLADAYGGPVAVNPKDGALVMERALYRVVCAVTEGSGTIRQLPGRAVLESEGQSLAILIWHRLLGVLVRESGF